MENIERAVNRFRCINWPCQVWLGHTGKTVQEDIRLTFYFQNCPPGRIYLYTEEDTSSVFNLAIQNCFFMLCNEIYLRPFQYFPCVHQSLEQRLQSLKCIYCHFENRFLPETSIKKSQKCFTIRKNGSIARSNNLFLKLLHLMVQ